MASHPAKGPADGPANYYPEEKPTGLLTRFVPNKLKHTALYRWFLRLTRVFQFLSALVSLGIFSQRLYKIYRLVNAIKTRRGVSGADDAVESILAVAVLYTVIITLLSCIKKKSSPGPRWLRWVWVLVDIAFVGAFIAVAIMTSPNGGKAGPRHCYYDDNNAKDDTCNMPWGTFFLAILSTILHAITASFHEISSYHRRT